jgi:hypothetical protein
MLSTGGSPFGVAVTPDGGYGFATVQDGGTGHGVIDVLRMAKTAFGQPVLVRSIAVARQPLGETITPDGKYLLAADGRGAVVISVARAESGAANAVLGMLAVGRGSGAVQAALSASAIEVATSRDGRYAFVTLEYDHQAAVFNLADAVSRGFGSGDYVGSIPLGQSAVGLAVSPSGRWLYATSESAAPAQHPTGIRAPAGGPTLPASQAARAGILPNEPPGTLTLIRGGPAGHEPVARAGRGGPGRRGAGRADRSARRHAAHSRRLGQVRRAQRARRPDRRQHCRLTGRPSRDRRRYLGRPVPQGHDDDPDQQSDRRYAAGAMSSCIPCRPPPPRPPTARRLSRCHIPGPGWCTRSSRRAAPSWLPRHGKAPLSRLWAAPDW